MHLSYHGLSSVLVVKPLGDFEIELEASRGRLSDDRRKLRLAKKSSLLPDKHLSGLDALGLLRLVALERSVDKLTLLPLQSGSGIANESDQTHWCRTMILARAFLASSLMRASTADVGRSVEAAIDCFGLRVLVPELRLSLCQLS